MITINTQGKGVEAVRHLREKGGKEAPGLPEEEASSSPHVESGDIIVCRACRSMITTGREAVSINAGHYHTFFNPAGIVYEIRCFSRAPGAVIHGEPTTDFTWFEGYAWQYCLCAHCLVHLGWFFSSDAGSFYGLIAAKLFAE